MCGKVVDAEPLAVDNQIHSVISRLANFDHFRVQLVLPFLICT